MASSWGCNAGVQSLLGVSELLPNVILFPSPPLSLSGELDANRPVPFRLTPPLQSFITQIGITGPFQLSILAACRCLVQPYHSLESTLKAILRDQFIAWKKVVVATSSALAWGEPDMQH